MTARRAHRSTLALAVGALLLSACSSSSGGGGSAASGPPDSAAPAGSASAAGDSGGDTSPASGGDRFGPVYDNTGTGPMVAPTVPQTPSVGNYFGQLTCTGSSTPPGPRQPAPDGCTRVFTLTALPVVQQIANFPMKKATVWGYQVPDLPPSSPGPTLISYADERVQIKEVNRLPEPTTIHVHGLHQPNESDGVSVISQAQPIAKGATFAYPAFVPGHVGSFAYHSHFDSSVQEMRGLNGMWDVLPRQQRQSVRVDVDVNMTLQIWGWEKEGSLVQPFGTGPAKQFPFDTINGKTGDASGGPITIEKGNRVRIRVYNASQQTHSMHLHGHDEIVTSKNGHAVAQPARETTQTVNPGDFYEIEFTADNPGNWIFHCHFPHHTANKMSSGYNGAPVGMTRIFHYRGAPDVAPQYFTSASFMSKTVG